MPTWVGLRGSPRRPGERIRVVGVGGETNQGAQLLFGGIGVGLHVVDGTGHRLVHCWPDGARDRGVDGAVDRGHDEIVEVGLVLLVGRGDGIVDRPSFRR